MGPARANVCSFIRRATIPSQRVIFIINIYKNTLATILYECYHIMHKNTFSLLQVKINHMTEIWNMHLFLAQWTVQLRTSGLVEQTLVGKCHAGLDKNKIKIPIHFYWSLKCFSNLSKRWSILFLAASVDFSQLPIFRCPAQKLCDQSKSVSPFLHWPFSISWICWSLLFLMVVRLAVDAMG